MLYRAEAGAWGTSRLGFAESFDGLHFTPRAEPGFSPETDHEKKGGVEGPRFVRIRATYPTKPAKWQLSYSPNLIHKTDAHGYTNTAGSSRHVQFPSRRTGPPTS